MKPVFNFGKIMPLPVSKPVYTTIPNQRPQRPLPKPLFIFPGIDKQLPIEQQQQQPIEQTDYYEPIPKDWINIIS